VIQDFDRYMGKGKKGRHSSKPPVAREEERHVPKQKRDSNAEKYRQTSQAGAQFPPVKYSLQSRKSRGVLNRENLLQKKGDDGEVRRTLKMRGALSEGNKGKKKKTEQKKKAPPH